MGHVTLWERYPQLTKATELKDKKDIYITNWGKPVLQIGAALSYYKSGQTLLQIGTASLLQIGQVLLQIGTAITN